LSSGRPRGRAQPFYMTFARRLLPMARVAGRLKKEFLDLLEKDLEFRYAVAGYLGLSEILKRLEEHDKKFEEVLAEIRALREGQNKLWENANKLWENVNKLWEEVRALREGQNKLWEEVRGLRETYVRLEGRATGLERAVATLARTVGATLNDFVASFVEEMLRLSGVPEEKIKVSASARIVYGETVREVDLFNVDPLVVGQVTTYISNVDEAKSELDKLLEDVRFVERLTGKKVFMAILAVENAPRDVVEFLEAECENLDVRFIPGRLITKIPAH